MISLTRASEYRDRLQRIYEYRRSTETRLFQERLTIDNLSLFATLNSSSTIFRLNVTPSLPWLSLRKLFMLIKLVHFLLADADAVWDNAESQTDECHNSRATKQYYPQFPNVIVVHIDIAPMWYVTYYCTCIFFSLYVKGCVYVVYNKLKIKSLNWIPVTIKFK